MTLRLILAVLHLLALGIGLGAVWSRARALRKTPDARDVRRALVADSWWGAAFALWLVTGLWRLLGSVEKSTAYYLDNHFFFMKMGFLGLILVLEVWPIVTLIRWRRDLGAGRTPDTSASGKIATISVFQVALTIAMVGAAAAMARGLGAGNPGMD